MVRGPPRSISRVTPVAASTEKRRPVIDCTITSVLPLRLASMPLALNSFGLKTMSPVSGTVFALPSDPSLAIGIR